jgi:hypothetical protein
MCREVAVVPNCLAAFCFLMATLFRVLSTALLAAARAVGCVGAAGAAAFAAGHRSACCLAYASGWVNVQCAWQLAIGPVVLLCCDSMF